MNKYMKRIMMLALSVLLVVSLVGCARLSTLKTCQADNAALQGKFDSLTTDAQKLQQDYATCQESLKASNLELSHKKKEVKETEVKVIEQSKAFKEMQDAMKAEMESKQVTIKELEGKLTLSMVESILFDSGKAVIKDEGIEALNKVAEVLKNTKGQEIMVLGHTDNVRIKGRLTKIYQTNWELSAARAISVVKLLQQNGVDPTLLSASGMGEFRPVADNDTPEGRSKNRRMEIVLMPKRAEK